MSNPYYDFSKFTCALFIELVQAEFSVKSIYFSLTKVQLLFTSWCDIREVSLYVSDAVSCDCDVIVARQRCRCLVTFHRHQATSAESRSSTTGWQHQPSPYHPPAPSVITSCCNWCGEDDVLDVHRVTARLQHSHWWWFERRRRRRRDQADTGLQNLSPFQIQAHHRTHQYASVLLSYCYIIIIGADF